MVYLPLFEYTAEYEPIKNMAYVIIVLLLISAGIQLFLSVRKKEEPANKAFSHRGKEKTIMKQQKMF